MKITELAVLAGAAVASSDPLVLVDVSDTSMGVTGTNKQIIAGELAIAMRVLGATLPLAGGTMTGPLVVAVSSAAAVPIIVKGAASQSANLFEAQDSTGTVHLAHLADGRLGIFKNDESIRLQGTGSYIAFHNIAGTRQGYFQHTGVVSSLFTLVNEVSGGHISLMTTGSGKVGVGTNSPGAMLEVDSSGAAVIGILVKAAASDTVEAFKAVDSTGTLRARIGYVNGGSDYGLEFSISGNARIFQAAGNLIVGCASASSVYLGEDADSGVIYVRRHVVGSAGKNIQADYFTNRANTKAYIDMQTTGIGVFVIGRTNVGDTTLHVRSMAAQTGAVQAWTDSTGGLLMDLNAVGNLRLAAASGSRITLVGSSVNQWQFDNNGGLLRIFRENIGGGGGLVRMFISDAGEVAVGGADVESGCTLLVNGYTKITPSSSAIGLVVQGNTGHVQDLLRLNATTGTVLLRMGNVVDSANPSIRSDGASLVINAVSGSAVYINYDHAALGLAIGHPGGFGGGQGMLAIANAGTVPTSNPSDAVLVYAQAGALKARGSSGTITTMAAADPHCPDCGRDFALEWESEEHGYLAICMWCFTDQMPRGVIAKREAVAA